MRRIFAAFLLICVSSGAMAQGLLADVFAGKLIEPEVGVYAWYELTDAESSMKFFLRQAIIDEEKVKRKDGFWVETELTPQVGYPMIYKMLITGPAYEAGNVHKIIFKEGNDDPQEIPVDPEMFTGARPDEGKREALPAETLTIDGNELVCEHFRVDQEGEVTEVWLNNTVRPIGVVKMTTPQGTLQLQRFGKGGPDAASAFDRVPPPGHEGKPDIEVHVGGQEPTKNFGGGGKE